MRIPIFQVDAFTGTVFGGNPAAVCPLNAWLPDEVLLAIAAENNLSETAFFIRDGNDYRLRWFTPANEVPLCGHATLASAFTILTLLDAGRDEVTFHTLSGPLKVIREGEGFAMSLPRWSAVPVEPPDGLFQAMSGDPSACFASERDYLVVYENESAVRRLAPDIAALGRLDKPCIIAMAPGERSDFVLRFFAPGHGVSEDPVTGSAQCAAAPYWADRLGRTDLTCHQVSVRGGSLRSRVLADTVMVSGECVLYLEGSIVVPG
jgi:predicted PhzF superfamily epimerase YddE/YHI9